MIGIVATMKVKPDKVAAFEESARELVEATNRLEPGLKFYKFFRSQSEPTTYTMMELYVDEAAFEAHRQSDHVRTIGAKLGPCLAGAPQLERYDYIAG